jgi:hypothetical protein
MDRTDSVSEAQKEIKPPLPSAIQQALSCLGLTIIFSVVNSSFS